MQSWRPSANGRIGRSSRCIRSSSLTPTGEDPRGRPGAQQSGLHCPWRSARWHEGHFGPVDRASEGAKFWLRVMNELKNRGVDDLLIAVVDGLKGFPDAITAIFPEATVQTCIVHLLRNSLDFVSYKDRKPVAAALKGIYRAVDAAAGEAALKVFEESFWGQKYPAIGQSWRR